MSLAKTYTKLKKKTEERSWYTKWVWWVAAAGLGIIVLSLWSLAKKQEARNRAALEIAESRASQARLLAQSEQDRELAQKYMREARLASREADKLSAKLVKSSKSRRELEAAVKGADSWEELDEIEEDIR